MPQRIGVGLGMKTGATNKRVRELISLVRDEKLIPRPDFQRRLVWTQRDKNNFIDTVLRGLPFPEIYVADGEVDLESGEGTQLLVDGLQRVNTLIEYFEASPNLKLLTVPAYQDLSEEDKKNFLQYEVAVRDLGAVSRDLLVEIFRRINATKYSLNDIEINNAVYAGALKQYAERLASNEFFTTHSVFTPQDYKRMGDLRFALIVIVTLIGGYFNRDDALEEFLERYNDEFPLEDEIDSRLDYVLQFIEECGFHPKSRAWKKADLFTLIVELDRQLRQGSMLDPRVVVETLEEFYSMVDNSTLEVSSVPGVYYKAALQATNDRINRVRRGTIIGLLLEGKRLDEIEEELHRAGLI